MKRFFLGLMVLAACTVVLGFYLGWFRIGSDTRNGTSNVTLSVDTKKFKEDGQTAASKVQDVGRKVTDRTASTDEKSMDGKVVSMSGDVLTMSDKAGSKHVHTLPSNVKITCDGSVCRSVDLKPGMRIRVLVDDAAPRAVSSIEALDTNAAFASRSYEGKVVSATGTKLVMISMDGREENTVRLTLDTKITCDGKVCPAAELRPGMRIRVTSESADPDVVTRIEAIDKDGDFEIRNRLN